jgi:hypothetical protein
MIMAFKLQTDRRSAGDQGFRRSGITNGNIAPRCDGWTVEGVGER